jgi:glycosyltransferase involved in cell wall biosynthesis
VPVRIYHVHGLPLTTATGLKRKLLCWTEWLSCYFSHQVLCVSRSVRDVAVKQRLCPAGKIKVLAQGSINGIDAQRRFNPQRLEAETGAQLRGRYGIPADARVLGFVGRIVRDKGLVELCAAWRELREQFADVHLLIAGPFESQDPVPPDVEHTLCTDNRIHLAGEVADMPALYSAVDVVLLPTYREGFPYVPLEAAAMGIPVVATRVPGCVEAVEDGVTGTLVSPRDAAALAEAVRRYLADADLRRRHGTAGRQRMLRDFQPETVWIALLQEYRRWLGIRGLVDKGAAEMASTAPDS